MEYDKFIKLTKASNPPTLITGVHLALWYALKNNWDKAHNIIQDINDETASWIHAYLHRIEGDIGNAHYWYARANKEPSNNSLQSELDEIIQSVLLHNIDT